MLGKIKTLILLSIPFLSFFFACNVNAANLPTTSFDMYYRATQDLGYIWYNNIGFNGNDSISPGGGILQYRINTGTVTANANNGVIHFETNIVASSVDQRTYNVWYHLDYQNIITCAASVSGVSVASKNLSYAVTNWTSQYGQALLYNSTLTFYGDVVLKGFTSGQQVYFTCAVGSDNYSFYYGGWPDFRTNRIYFEQNPMSISWTNNETDTLLNVVINQNNEYYQTEYYAVDSINNQSTSDITGAENQQTTSIIGVISSFVSALGSVQTGSCELTLPFPMFAGGSQVVDPCSGKSIAPTMVTVASSMLLIGVFIPFAFIVLRMIYNEIRSFTNG